MITKNKTLSILLIIQLIVIAFVYWPSSEQATQKTAFFSDTALEQIKGFTITDDENNSISLNKQEGNWLSQQGAYPANRETIETLLGKILSLQSARLVTNTQSSQVRLKVSSDVFNRKVDLLLADGNSKSFFLGTSPNNKTIHFRLAGENEVFIVKDLASWEMQTDKESWWQTTYVSVPKDELAAVKITNPNGTLTVQKGAEDKWLVAEANSDQNVSADKIETLMGSFAKISLGEYISREQPEGLGEPICTVEYTTIAGAFVLTIWAADEEKGSHIAKASNRDFYVTIQAYLLENFLDAQLSDYLGAGKTPPPDNSGDGEQREKLPKN